MPIQGFVRLRKHQFTRQSVFGTAEAATRAYGFDGTPDRNLNWTDPNVSTGSLDPVAPPYRARPDLTASLTTDSLHYNDLPLMLACFFGGGVEPTGATAQTWAWDPSSATVDEPDVATYEFGDDVTTDWDQLRDGILETLEFSGPEGLGPVTASMGWRFGAYFSSGSTDSPDDPTVPTPGLEIDTQDVIVYLKDAAIYIADTLYDLFEPGTKISDALHTFTLRLGHEVDLKAFANGTQTFDIAAYGPGARTIELEATWAKTVDIVGVNSESDKWMSDSAQNRYIGIEFTSTELAESPSTFYSWQFAMPARWYTRTEGESGQNTTVILTAHAFYDGSRIFPTTVVNTLTGLELGIVGS